MSEESHGDEESVSDEPPCLLPSESENEESGGVCGSSSASSRGSLALVVAAIEGCRDSSLGLGSAQSSSRPAFFQGTATAIGEHDGDKLLDPGLVGELKVHYTGPWRESENEVSGSESGPSAASSRGSLALVVAAIEGCRDSSLG